MNSSKSEAETIGRRQTLKIIGFGGLMTFSSAMQNNSRADDAPSGRKRVLRLAHVTDIHVQPEYGAAEGMVQMLRHLQAQPDPPELVLNTGDSIFDSMSQVDARAKLLWDLWKKITTAELRLKMESALGNHDIWGWAKAKSGTTGNEPGWGKDRALKALGLSAPYRSFDYAGWHFIVLDSIHVSSVAGQQYKGKLDEQQFAWLVKDLSQTDPHRPVLVMSHIPILSATPLVTFDADVTGEFAFGGGSMHTDVLRIKSLFKEHPNVKIAISGHSHLIDRVDYAGVSYLCNGAVCGGWWRKKSYQDCDAGYALIDLFDDGTFEHKYVTYGWVYRPE